MSRVVIPSGEETQATKRRPLTRRRQLAIHAFHKGVCRECNTYVPADCAIFDHEIPIWMGGPDDDGPNMGPLHPWCDKHKTKKDQGNIAKVKRLKKKPKKSQRWLNARRKQREA